MAAQVQVLPEVVSPTDSQHQVIVGRNGTGKTQAGIHQLSLRSYDQMPWIIFDFKGDELIGQIPKVRQLTLQSEIPSVPGLYVVHPRPGQEADVEAFLWKIHAHGNIGVYIDEGLMLGQHNDAFRAILTQGRSLRIPMIVLSQRPSWLDVFLFSEATYYQVFNLNKAEDRKKMMEVVPADIDGKLPEYHSYWYDVKRDITLVLKPVPESPRILGTFYRRLKELEERQAMEARQTMISITSLGRKVFL